jgi:hypothetical protein
MHWVFSINAEIIQAGGLPEPETFDIIIGPAGKYFVKATGKLSIAGSNVSLAVAGRRRDIISKDFIVIFRLGPGLII